MLIDFSKGFETFLSKAEESEFEGASYSSASQRKGILTIAAILPIGKLLE